MWRVQSLRVLHVFESRTFLAVRFQLLKRLVIISVHFASETASLGTRVPLWWWVSILVHLCSLEWKLNRLLCHMWIIRITRRSGVNCYWVWFFYHAAQLIYWVTRATRIRRISKMKFWNIALVFWLNLFFDVVKITACRVTFVDCWSSLGYLVSCICISSYKTLLEVVFFLLPSNVLSVRNPIFNNPLRMLVVIKWLIWIIDQERVAGT